MDRRTVLRNLATLVVAASSTPLIARAASTAQVIQTGFLTRRYVLIGDLKGSETSNFLSALSPFLSKTRPGWLRSFQAFDLVDDEDLIRDLLAKYGPNTTAANWPVVVSIPSQTANTDMEGEIEVWSAVWLAHHQSLAIEKSCYPILNEPWWSVEGDWHPSAEKVRTHLFHSPNHTDGKFTSEWLAGLKLEELQSCHSDHHYELAHTPGYKLHREYVNQECPRQT